MDRLNPVTVGLATAITLAIVNSLCAVVVWLWPDAVFTIAGSFAHGLNFRAMQSTESLSLARFLAGLVSIGIIGFVIGAVFAWTYNALRRP
jgi:hypothetical protein